MRSLHPVGAHETFVASGVYKHFENGQLTGTLERWSIHELPDKARIIRVDEDWRERDGSSVLIEAWRSPAGKIERFDIHGLGGKNDNVKDIRATFTFNEGLLELGRTIDHGTRQQLEVVLPEDYIVSPKSILFSGFEVAQLAAHTENEATIVSYFPTFVEADTAFKPVSYRQAAKFVAEETVHDLADNAHAARRYELTHHGSPVWLDKNNILIKFSSPDGAHSAVLTQYAHRPT